MNKQSNIMGIDIGSVSISVVEVTPQKEIVQAEYVIHNGEVATALRKVLLKFDWKGICGVAATETAATALNVDHRYDSRVCIIEACYHFHGQVGAILHVGGEKFGVIHFDNQGNYLSYKTNTSCAAGTGSFLDQQASRLNLSGISELSDVAFRNPGEIPKIASRCAVFAKTDLIHAQQEGYSIEAICDGLCFGLAKNITDTLFPTGSVNEPVIFTGGVSKNRAVVKHIKGTLGKGIQVERFPYGAVGAAFNLLGELSVKDRIEIHSVEDLICQKRGEKKYFYPPLNLLLSDYPDFNGFETYRYDTVDYGLIGLSEVEVDIYLPLKPKSERQYQAFLGLDIGSTSTKAVLIDHNRHVIAGFYTKTAGRPIDATRKILAAISEIIEKRGVDIAIIGAGTTGSGRKFIGKIIGADLILDEITAHARAACELNPSIDTIIEIGGQDSKFTTLKDGRVTFSTMNAVCAAGTGSFIEEQAQRLQCPLSEYAGRTIDKQAPIASDRCTVFMERDINHYLSEGYLPDEVLTSVLHSICENYLTKVAIESSIGDTITFQGATAKNRALVAAFEHRLGKPIFVSKYCHLTGALGTALSLAEQPAAETKFRGISIYRHPVDIQSEVCELCTNHCKITLADINNERVGYGFLCGRDYDTKKYLSSNTSGFDLLKQRKRVFAVKSKKRSTETFTVGIPAALHIFEDFGFWKKFFSELAIETISSEGYGEAMKEGKRLAGAEFCAPLAALHGHVNYLLDRADYVFLPFYLEKKTAEKSARRQYCYYTQYSPALATLATDPEKRKRILLPLENYLYSNFYDRVQLYRMLRKISKNRVRFLDVSAAYNAAVEFKQSCLKKLRKIYREKSRSSNDYHVVLLGRPYTVLSSRMNNGIPGIFASHGIQTFFQDMLSYGDKEIEPIKPLLSELHWHYAAEIVSAADVIAKSDNAYPVMITSFKCTPDAFVIDYFKKIMDAHGKPYLILQLDGHDSSVGYETRIEAAIRSFHNHYEVKAKRKPPVYAKSLFLKREKQILDKTLLMPNWDNISLKLVAASLRREGIDVRLLDENQTSIQNSMRFNTGQCIPLNIIAQECVDYVETHGLNPEKTAIWLGKSSVSCNLGLFPHHINSLLHRYGGGMEKIGVYAGSLSFLDISMKLPVSAYLAYMFGGMIRKIGCKIRPYEKVKGETDRVIERNVAILYDAFLGHGSKEAAVGEAVANFARISQHKPDSSGSRPKVALFGDLYVLENEVINQDITHFIEDNGGEVVVTPYSSHIKMIAKPYIRKWFREGLYFNSLSARAMLVAFNRLEKQYYPYFNRVLNEPLPLFEQSPDKILTEYNVRMENTGEAIENLLKIFYTIKHYPDIAFFVQLSPAFCCPSLVTEAMACELERKTDVPIVSITYDGTGGNKNDAIIPYLKYPRTCYDSRILDVTVNA